MPETKPISDAPSQAADSDLSKPESARQSKDEVGGRGGPDPTRYGDWEKNGRCIDF